MSQNFPPSGTSPSGCPQACPDAPECEKNTGEFRFTGPATIYSFNVLEPLPVFQVVEGRYLYVGTFGGKSPFQREFKICGEYVVRWNLQGELPDCSTVTPVIYKSCIARNASPQITCLKKNNSDEPRFQAWAYACGDCGDDELQVEIYTSDGKQRLSLDDYQIVSCC